MLKQLISLFSRKRNYGPYSEDDYKRDKMETLDAVHNTPEHSNKLHMLFTHVIKYAKANPCFVFVIDKEKNYYLQCSASPQELWCEVVGNEYITNEAKLSNEQLDQLRAIGWNISDDENYSMAWNIEGQYNLNKTIETCIKSLDVYGLSKDSILEIDTFTN